MRKIRDVALGIHGWRTPGVVYVVEGARHEGFYH